MRAHRTCLLLTASLLALRSGPAPLLAQPPGAAPRLLAETAEGPRPLSPRHPIFLVADLDDEDEDGRLDAEQSSPPPAGLLPLQLLLPAEVHAVRLQVRGPVRIVWRGQAVGTTFGYRVPRSTASTSLRFALQATAVPDTRTDPVLEVSTGQARLRFPLSILGLRLLRGANRPLDPLRASLGPSHRVTHDASLPRDTSWDTESPDPENVRVEVYGIHPPTEAATLRLHALRADGTLRRALELPLVSRPHGSPWAMRSPWVRLVTDEVDLHAPGVSQRLLRVALRDVVEATYTLPGLPPLRQRWRVGRPGRENGPQAARRAHLRIRVLRLVPGGPPVLGDDDREALRLARRQVVVANEVWAQCFLDFGPPESADVALVDPPSPALLSVSDAEGLPAAGGGVVRFRVDGRLVGPLTTRPGEAPVRLALRLAERLRRMGYRPSVRELPPVTSSSGRAADLYVRRSDGRPAVLGPDGTSPLSTDARQRLRIGEVDLTDGLDQFDNSNHASGTLEERALLYGVIDDDPRTIDVLIVDRFAGGGRLGEAFIEMRGGPIVDAVVIDRNGIRTERAAWTMAHELGHVLLDQPLHPDQVGPDRPWLLMDADVARADVSGPKRILPEECARLRRRSGLHAIPPLLRRRPDEEPGEPTPPR